MTLWPISCLKTADISPGVCVVYLLLRAGVFFNMLAHVPLCKRHVPVRSTPFSPRFFRSPNAARIRFFPRREVTQAMMAMTQSLESLRKSGAKYRSKEVPHALAISACPAPAGSAARPLRAWLLRLRPPGLLWYHITQQPRAVTELISTTCYRTCKSAT